MVMRWIRGLSYTKSRLFVAGTPPTFAVIANLFRSTNQTSGPLRHIEQVDATTAIMWASVDRKCTPKTRYRVKELMYR